MRKSDLQLDLKEYRGAIQLDQVYEWKDSGTLGCC